MENANETAHQIADRLIGGKAVERVLASEVQVGDIFFSRTPDQDFVVAEVLKVFGNSASGSRNLVVRVNDEHVLVTEFVSEADEVLRVLK